MGDTTVYIDAVAPEGLTVTIDPPDSDPTILFTVSTVTLVVKPPTGPNVNWVATKLTQTPYVVRYNFQSGDVAAVGNYIIVPYLAVPGGIVRALKFTLTVENPFA